MKKGFTMIELIFVIVILGVLAAVAIPKLNATRDDAEQAKAMTNLATLMGDLTSYYTAQGTFADNIGSMTNVPLSVATSTENKGEFKIKDKTCLTFTVNKTNGTLSVTSPELSPNPVCNNLITNTSTQNILSGSYTCKGEWKGVAQPAGSTTYVWQYTPVEDETTKEDKDGVMANACKDSTPPTTAATNGSSAPAVVPSKMDAFNKTITMNFQGGGVAF